MTELPFSLSIKPTSPKSRSETLVCVGSLRLLPGKREVLDAVWDKRPVVLKVFAEPLKAKWHMKRDRQGLKRLEKLGLNTPKALLCGKTNDGRYAVVTEKITDASTLSQLKDNTTDPEKKLQLLLAAGRELAKQHTKGVLQKDLHLGNFLLQGEKLFTLDPAHMRFVSGQIRKKQALAQLASLACNLPDEDTDAITSLCQEYAQARSWKFSAQDSALFTKQLAACRKRGIKRTLKKCLRTSKRCVLIKHRGHCGVAAVDFYQRADFSEFLQDLDKLMQAGQILKNGNTCFVSRLIWADQDVVVKRYNYKGIIHSVRHTIKRSRARRSWLHAHRLWMLNIATPRPLAYIESYKGMIVWKSYLITEYAKGRKLYDFMRDGKTDENQRSKVTGQVKELLERLGKYRITHGDLKHTNILITEKGPVLTDLDGMKVHKQNWTYQRRRTKDYARLLKDWPGEDVISLQG